MTQPLKSKHAQKTILIGMTGRIDSTVAAYLLKKQGHNVIGIGILFNDLQEELPRNPKTGEVIKPFGVQFIHDLDRVKGVCDELEIPFYGVHAEEHYQDKVEDFIVAARLAGTTYSPLVYSSRLIVEILVDKMAALNADYVATGNYAKIATNPTTGAIVLSQSNDLQNDETFQMAQINPYDARHLQLPLAEMRRKEVLKVYESLQIKNRVSDKEIKGDKIEHILIMEDPRVEGVVKKMSSKDLIRTGSIVNYMEDTILSDHDGIHKYYIGQTKIKSKGVVTIDQKLQVVAIDPKIGDIYLCPPDELKFTYCELSGFSTGKGRDVSVPMGAYVKFRPDLLKVPCDVYLGNNDSAVLEFKKAHEGQLVKGQYVVIYDREGEGARVIGGGVVNHSGYIDSRGINRDLPLTNVEKEDELDTESTQRKRNPFSF